MAMALRCTLPKVLQRSAQASCSRYFCSGSGERRTALCDFHREHGGKMVDFAGWQLPAVYSSSTPLQSTEHTRSQASLFDVSHMLQWSLTGRDASECLERICVADVAGIGSGRGTLSVLTNEQGGIIDDFIINRVDADNLYIVSNAGNAEKDIAHVKPIMDDFARSGKDVAFSVKEDVSLLALQGPQSAAVLAEGTPYSLAGVAFMGGFTADLFGVPGCRVTRCGYTGEDGFELSVPSAHAVFLAERLLAACGGDAVKLAGLAARDTLRLEAGLCLHGSDIDETTTPVEAGLTWCIGKRRKESFDFIGGPAIRQQIKEKPSRRRVGFVSTGPVARGGSKVLSMDGTEIGHITSGAPSPTLGKNVAMGYISTAYAKVGTTVKLQVRKRAVDSATTKMPFVPANYYTPTQKS